MMPREGTSPEAENDQSNSQEPREEMPEAQVEASEFFKVPEALEIQVKEVSESSSISSSEE
jgi:hypothetical protein